MVRIIADEFLTEERDRKYYADHYTCCPPPLFILFITLIEVSHDFEAVPSTWRIQVHVKHVMHVMHVVQCTWACWAWWTCAAAPNARLMRHPLCYCRVSKIMEETRHSGEGSRLNYETGNKDALIQTGSRVCFSTISSLVSKIKEIAL